MADKWPHHKRLREQKKKITKPPLLSIVIKAHAHCVGQHGRLGFVVFKLIQMSPLRSRSCLTNVNRRFCPVENVNRNFWSTRASHFGNNMGLRVCFSQTPRGAEAEAMFVIAVHPDVRILPHIFLTQFVPSQRELAIPVVAQRASCPTVFDSASILSVPTNL